MRRVRVVDEGHGRRAYLGAAVVDITIVIIAVPEDDIPCRTLHGASHSLRSHVDGVICFFEGRS